MEARWLHIVVLLAAVVSLPFALSSRGQAETYQNPGQNHTSSFSFAVGDPRRCKLFNPKGFRMEVLPGGGWDNLQNLHMGEVLAVNYSQCRTTADGKYLIPDHTFVVPMKRSRLDMFSEVFEHWSDYTSVTSNSINEAASLFSFASGSFSYDFQYNKEHQVYDRSFTTRVQARHSLYTIKSQPDAPLNPAFTRRLMQIAANLQNNQTELAWYLTQLLVREFGTHYLTSIDAGAAVVKEDHIKQNFLKDTSKTIYDIKAAASISFFFKVKIGINASSEMKMSRGTLEEYRGNQTSSRIFTHGGPPFVSNFNLNDWENGIANELVPIDKTGDPLHYAITTGSLPGLPEPTVRQLSSLVEDAIKMYFKVNTIPGCTNSESPNFHFQSNIDDGTCKNVPSNFTFGSVYQKCYPVSEGAGNLCKKLEQKNPLTGDFTCPVGFEPVLLIHPGGKRPSASTSYHKTQCHDSCHSCGFLWLETCCRAACQNVLHYSQAEYDTYWCAATGNVPPGSGVLFGGVYSDSTSNPITGAHKCPQRFYPMPLGGHAHVCVSDDYELGYQYSLRFAGFFSCSSGNPLAIPKRKTPGNGTTLRGSLLGMEQFLFVTPYKAPSKPDSYGPRHCPSTYSPHLVTVDNQCEISYCIKSGSFDDRKLNPVKRPPFSPRPGVNPSATEAIAVIGVNGKVWMKNVTNGDWTLQEFYQESASAPASGTSEHPGLSPGAAAAISISVTTLAGVLMLIVFVGYRRRRESRRYRGSGLLDSYVEERQPVLNSAAQN